MRIVAIRANHFAFTYRVAGRAVNQCANVFVAIKANFCLCDSIAHFVLFGVDLMAGSASNIAIGVQTAGPMHALAALVASQASVVSFFDRIE